MPLSTDVNLPKKHEAIFPERCVRCGCDPEGRSIRIWTSSIGWWTAVFWMFGRGFTARIPACRSCGWRIRVQRVGGLICVVVFGFFFLVLVRPYLERFLPRALRKWVPWDCCCYVCRRGCSGKCFFHQRLISPRIPKASTMNFVIRATRMISLN